MIAILILALLGYVNAQGELSDCVDSSWYSEEEGWPKTYLPGYPTAGLACHEKHCDQMKDTQCKTLTVGGKTLDLVGSTCIETTDTFSDEDGDHGLDCPEGMFLESMHCKERYCDIISLRCCQSQTWLPDLAKATYTGYFSDDGSTRCPDMNVAIGASCTGDYCDNMRLHCAPVNPYSTGGQSSGFWNSACSSSADDCSYKYTQTVTRERQSTWDDSFTNSVDASLKAGIIFLDAEISMTDSVTKSVEYLVSLQANVEIECSPEIPRKLGNLGGVAWWQWITETEDVNILDTEGGIKYISMATCDFFQTSGLNVEPKCPAGCCNDDECQTCITDTPECIF